MGKKKAKEGLGEGANAAELFTVEQLTKISQNQDPVASDLAGDVAALIPEMRKGGIVTRNQITAFLANVCQETDHLNTLAEYGNAAGIYPIINKPYTPTVQDVRRVDCVDARRFANRPEPALRRPSRDRPSTPGHTRLVRELLPRGSRESGRYPQPVLTSRTGPR